MGIVSKVFRRKNETVVYTDDILLKALVNGESITREMALSIPVVAADIDLITSTISMIPIKLYKEEVNNNSRKVTEVRGDNRVKLLNDDTKDTLTGVQFKKAISTDYLLGKGGYGYINKYRNTVKSLHYVDESKITISINSDPIKKHYEILINGESYKDYNFIKILRNTKDGASGISVINQISKALETAYQQLKYQLSLLKNGGNKRGFLKSEKKLTEEAMKALKSAWENLYKNDNNENMIILNEGMDFKECSNSSVELQLNETKNSLTKDINDIFHIKDKYEDTFKQAIQPILTEIECSINRDLLLESEKEEGYFFAFDLKEISKVDLKARFEAYQIALKSGWKTPNEIRYLENDDPIEGLDIISMSLGDVIYDIKTKTYYTPNTDSSKSMSKGGDNNEEDEK